MLRKLVMAFLSWLGKWWSNRSNTAPATSSSAVLPLPTSSVAAVAGAVIETERTLEQQVALKNAPDVRAAKVAQQQVDVRSKIERDVAEGNLDEIRKDIAE